MRIAFIGLGRMGGPIAQRLMAAGHALTVHDVRESAASVHVEKGARYCHTAGEACKGAELVFTCLPGPPEVEATFFGADGLLHACDPGTVYVDLSSNAVSLVRRMHAALAERDCPMLDAPVSGGVGGAPADRHGAPRRVLRPARDGGRRRGRRPTRNRIEPGRRCGRSCSLPADRCGRGQQGQRLRGG